MATETDTVFEVSASGVAMIWTIAGEGGNDGAVYRPLDEIVPQAAPEQPDPETLQEIALEGFELAAGINVAA
jgi:hypothetical protein